MSPVVVVEVALVFSSGRISSELQEGRDRVRTIWTITSGVALTMLLVVLPMLHVTHWQGAAPSLVSLGLAALPFVVIAFAVVRPSPWVVLWLFPVAHLPVLVQRPELTGPLVYSGSEGLVALALVAALGCLWVRTALASSDRSVLGAGTGDAERSFDVVSAAAILSAAAIWSAFIWPMLGAAQAERSQASALVVALAGVVIILVSGRWITRDLGAFRGDERRRRRWTVALLRERQPHLGRLWGALSVTALGSLMVLVLYR